MCGLQIKILYVCLSHIGENSVGDNILRLVGDSVWLCITSIIYNVRRYINLDGNSRKMNMQQTSETMNKKPMKDQLVSIVVGLSFTTAGAILSSIFPDFITVKDSISIGIFSYIISILFFIESRLRVLGSIETIDNNMTYVSNYLMSEEKALRKGNDSFSIFLALSMIRAKEGIYKLIDSNTFVVEREQLPNFWQQAIINTDISWFCTTYSNTPDDFTGWAKRGFELQGMGVEQMGTLVKRLFIVNNESEITDDLIDRMEWHQSLGINVKWIPRNIDLKWAPFKKFEDIIGTIDIAIINGSYLFAFEIDEVSDGKRGISSLTCYANMDIVNRITSLFTHLWDNSREIADLKKEVSEEK